MKPRHLIPAILLALLLAYPLSLGPVVRWYWQHPKGKYYSTIEAFYRPLAFFCDHVPLAAKAMDQYVELWVQRVPPPVPLK
jgi:hypothetical protein